MRRSVLQCSWYEHGGECGYDERRFLGGGVALCCGGTRPQVATGAAAAIGAELGGWGPVACRGGRASPADGTNQRAGLAPHHRPDAIHSSPRGVIWHRAAQSGVGGARRRGRAPATLRSQGASPDGTRAAAGSGRSRQLRPSPTTHSTTVARAMRPWWCDSPGELVAR